MNMTDRCDTFTHPIPTFAWVDSRLIFGVSGVKEVGYGMEMDSYKSRISDGVLVQKRNRTSRCLKLLASVSQFFGTKRTHSRIPGLKGEALFSKRFFAVCRS
jgi:hypothetical protein